jgi:hypothetical protein
VPLGRDLIPNLFDLAIGINQKSATHNSHERAAHEFLHAPGPVGLNGLVIGIAQERKVQLAFGLEIGKRFHGIRAHAQDHRTGLFKLLEGVTKLGRFGDSTGSIGFGKEKQDYVLAGKILQGYGGTAIGMQRKLWSFVTELKHDVSPGLNAWAVRSGK